MDTQTKEAMMKELDRSCLTPWRLDEALEWYLEQSGPQNRLKFSQARVVLISLRVRVGDEVSTDYVWELVVNELKDTNVVASQDLLGVLYQAQQLRPCGDYKDLCLTLDENELRIRVEAMPTLATNTAAHRLDRLRRWCISVPGRLLRRRLTIGF